jgi:hypothetical protein
MTLERSYWPITTRFAFLERPLEDVAEVLEGWCRGLDGDVRRQPAGGFPQCLEALEPLTSPSGIRTLLVETDSPWTALFDNGFPSPDPVSSALYLSRVLQSRGLIVVASRDTLSFQLLADSRTHFLNFLRVVELSSTEGSWTFSVSGDPQPFEEVAVYQARRKRDRFSSELLERYCSALGIRVFDSAFYGPRSELIERQTAWKVAQALSLAEAQARSTHV